MSCVSASLCAAAVAAACSCLCSPSCSAHQPFAPRLPALRATLAFSPLADHLRRSRLPIARRLCSPPRTLDHRSPPPRGAQPAARHLPLPGVVPLTAAFALGVGHWDQPPTMAE